MEYKKGDILVVQEDCVCAGVNYRKGDEWEIYRLGNSERTVYLTSSKGTWAISPCSLDTHFTLPSKYPRIKTQFLGGLNEFL